MDTTAQPKATRSLHTTFKYHDSPAGGYVIRIDVETERAGREGLFLIRVSRTHFAQDGQRQWDGTLTASQTVKSRTLHLAHQEACFYVEALFGFDDE